MSSGPDHIMVALADPTARPGPLLARAGEIASRSGARVTIFHSLYSPFLTGQQYYSEEELQHAIAAMVDASKAELESLAKPLRTMGIDVHVRVRWDYPPHESIVREVLREKIALLLVGTHRHSRVARLVLTNTDWQLIRSSPCPVLLVKGTQPYDNAPVLVSVDPMHANAKPEALDVRLLDAGRDFAKLFASPVHAAHFHSFGFPMMAGFMVEPVPVPPQVNQEYINEVKDAFASLVKPLALPPARQHLRPGFPVEELPLLAGEIGAGVVVMGAVSRSAVKRLFIGNTAESVIDALPCDVLVIKPADFRTDVPRRAYVRPLVVPTF
jgi:universal stress protein E